MRLGEERQWDAKGKEGKEGESLHLSEPVLVQRDRRNPGFIILSTVSTKTVPTYSPVWMESTGKYTHGRAVRGKIRFIEPGVVVLTLK